VRKSLFMCLCRVWRTRVRDPERSHPKSHFVSARRSRNAREIGVAWQTMNDVIQFYAANNAGLEVSTEKFIKGIVVDLGNGTRSGRFWWICLSDRTDYTRWSVQDGRQRVELLFIMTRSSKCHANLYCALLNHPFDQQCIWTLRKSTW